MLDTVNKRPVAMPVNLLTSFFEGDVEAWGLVVPRFGSKRRRFSLHMSGSWTGNRLLLAERFVFDDDTLDNRVWEFALGDGNEFTGVCDDVKGHAAGTVTNDMLMMRYVFNLSVGGRIVPVRFDDRMYRIDDRTVANRAVMYKFGVRLGEVNAVFRRKHREGRT